VQLRIRIDRRPRRESTCHPKVKGDHLERFAEEALEHLRLIHKYTAWMAFFIVLFGVLALIGFLLGNLNASM
jgi:hypothetical protein